MPKYLEMEATIISKTDSILGDENVYEENEENENIGN